MVRETLHVTETLHSYLFMEGYLDHPEVWIQIPFCNRGQVQIQSIHTDEIRFYEAVQVSLRVTSRMNEILTSMNTGAYVDCCCEAVPNSRRGLVVQKGIYETSDTFG
jgi:hypothetical protein